MSKSPSTDLGDNSPTELHAIELPDELREKILAGAELCDLASLKSLVPEVQSISEKHGKLMTELLSNFDFEGVKTLVT